MGRCASARRVAIKTEERQNIKGTLRNTVTDALCAVSFEEGAVDSLGVARNGSVCRCLDGSLRIPEYVGPLLNL